MSNLLNANPILPTLRASCATCSLHQLCLPVGLEKDELTRLDNIIGKRHRIARGESLYHIGDPFTMLYAIRFGHFKTFQNNANGNYQITGFHMSGELLGMDAISTDRHLCEAVALEDSEVCEIPYAKLENLLQTIPTLLRHFHRVMSREISHDQSVMLLLSNMKAHERLAAFLLNLSSRYAARGYSSNHFQLRMTREEIGNYLGLAVESVSRLFSDFKKKGWININHREVEILDMQAFRSMVMGDAAFCE